MNFKDLIEKAGLSAEDKAAAERIFSVDALRTGIEEEAMHRANSAFQADRAALQSNWDTANAEYVTMQGKVSELEVKIGATEAEKQDAARKLAAAESKVADLSKFDPEAFKKEVLAQAAEFNVGARSFELDALDAVHDHQQLFGERLSPKQLALDALAAKKSPVDYWSEKYNVAAKRAEIAKTAHDTEIAAAEARGRDAYIAAQANPATRQQTSSNNPFYVPAADAKTSVNPWDMNDTPADEQALLTELSRARVQ